MDSGDYRKLPTESDWEWMERCPDDHPAAIGLRTLKHWLTNCPDDWATELLSRLQATAKGQFDAAFFELYLFTTLRSLPGIHVTPIVEKAQPNMPDLEVRFASGASFYIEAKVITDQEAEQAQDHRAYQLLVNAGEFAKSRNWRFWIIEFRGTTRTASPRRAAKLLDQWLQNLDPGAIRDHIDSSGFNLDEMPYTTLVDQKSGWKLGLRAIPHPDPHADCPIKPAADGSFPVYASQIPERFIKAVDRKLQQHRSLRDKTIIALCCNHSPSDLSENTCLDALLGPAFATVNRLTGELVSSGRKPTGLWTRDKRTRTVPPAVLTCSRVLPWHLPPQDLRVWTNPWADETPELPIETISWDVSTGEQIRLNQ